jgi:hypothetical protein
VFNLIPDPALVSRIQSLVNPYEEWGYYDYENETGVFTSSKKASSVIYLNLE